MPKSKNKRKKKIAKPLFQSPKKQNEVTREKLDEYRRDLEKRKEYIEDLEIPPNLKH